MFTCGMYSVRVCIVYNANAKTACVFSTLVRSPTGRSFSLFHSHSKSPSIITMKCSCTSPSISKVTLSTPVAVYDIEGCDRGLHSVTRIGAMSSTLPDTSIKCKVLDGSSGKYLSGPVRQAVEWLFNYFTIANMNSKQKEAILAGAHPPICPDLNLSMSLSIDLSTKTYLFFHSYVQRNSPPRYISS